MLTINDLCVNEFFACSVVLESMSLILPEDDFLTLQRRVINELKLDRLTINWSDHRAFAWYFNGDDPLHPYGVGVYADTLESVPEEVLASLED